MPHTAFSDEEQIQRIYTRVALLGLLLHAAQAIFFGTFSFYLLMFYNCGSTLFYGIMILIAKRKMFRTLVSCVHIEVSFFVIVCVVYCGWKTGTAIFLLAVSSLVYFCPFNRKYIPYFFSLAELVIFVALRIYTYFHEPILNTLPVSAESALYVFNALGAFYTILFSAYSSNISATVTNARLKNENQNLTAIANFDFLTTLPSRRSFLHDAKSLPPDTSVFAAIGDLDNFKYINDNYGHPTGDFVLQKVGHLLSTFSGENTLTCRWGGEEFIVLFYDCTAEEVQSRLQNLCDRVSAKSFEYGKHSLKVTITFGAYAGNMNQGIETLIAKADKYLYNGKQNGKNCVVTSFDHKSNF